MTEKLIEVKNLKLYFKQQTNDFSFQPKYLKAVDDISFYINKGETFGLVGESGCGKSTVGKSILRQYDLTGGNIYFDGDEIGNLKSSKLMPYRKKMQAIFQDPYASLNPVKTILNLVCEPMNIHNLYTKQERKERAAKMLETVGLKKSDLNRYPYEFSGGQKQRICIARALSINPSFVLCDEPISSLDVSMQAQIVKMLDNLQQQMGLTYLFISHQLLIVKQLAQNVGVMYLGNLVEVGPADEIYKNPRHPYTKALISSILLPDPQINNLDISVLIGDIPRPIDAPTGCKFRTRCPRVMAKCKEEPIKLLEVSPKHYVTCHLYK